MSRRSRPDMPSVAAANAARSAGCRCWAYCPTICCLHTHAHGHHMAGSCFCAREEAASGGVSHAAGPMNGAVYGLRLGSALQCGPVMVLACGFLSSSRPAMGRGNAPMMGCACRLLLLRTGSPARAAGSGCWHRNGTVARGPDPACDLSPPAQPPASARLLQSRPSAAAAPPAAAAWLRASPHCMPPAGGLCTEARHPGSDS